MRDSAQPKLTGGCHCGKVRYEVTGPAGAATICHCRSCQRCCGAQSVGWVEFKLEQVSWSGQERTSFASSKQVERTFCSHCGCSLSYQRKADSIDLTIASLDNPEAVKPSREIWLDHRLSWTALNHDLDHQQN